jgi:hypothetical protein
MAFPLDREPDHFEPARTGFVLRAFTERAFGVLQDGTVVRVDRARRLVRVAYCGYREWRPFAYGGFVYPRGHPLTGQAFTFINPEPA